MDLTAQLAMGGQSEGELRKALQAAEREVATTRERIHAEDLDPWTSPGLALPMLACADWSTV